MQNLVTKDDLRRALEHSSLVLTVRVGLMFVAMTLVILTALCITP